MNNNLQLEIKLMLKPSFNKAMQNKSSLASNMKKPPELNVFVKVYENYANVSASYEAEGSFRILRIYR